ncbi:hypothetical protein AADZ86_11065 [Colwelliaceae bacterium BS250]
MKKTQLGLATFVLLNSASASANIEDLKVSAIINVGYTERDEFSGIAGYGVDEHSAGLKQGFWNDHSEISISAPIDDMFFGKLTMALDDHEGETEIELEEAFVQTTAMPYDLSIRVGRFLSDIGYLNGKHNHTDSFADRPLVYRAFLNGHYYDDGARLSWLAPTDMYLEFGSEIFKGGKMPAYTEGDGIGAYSVFAKTGGDFNLSNSWQLGASFLAMDNDTEHCSSHGHEEGEHEEGEHDEADGHVEDEHESFGACDFSGDKEYFMVDAVWKWAPNGNYKYQNFTLAAEYFQVSEKGELHHDEHEEHEELEPQLVGSILADEHENIDVEHKGFYVSGVYQFAQNWAAGLRYSQIDFDEPYSDGFKPKVSTAMIEYRHSHFSTVRLQYNQDKSTEDMNDDQITLQFSMSLGAHGAHQF